MSEQRANANENPHEEEDRQLFDAISGDYVKKDLVASSRVARRFRLRQSLAAVPVSSSCVLLEVGCGAGFSSQYLTGLFARYYGVDYSEALIQFARDHHSATHVHFCAQNIKDFEPPEKVDVILMIGVLHHLENIPETLGLLHDMLRPGGVLITNEPHPGNPFVSMARALRKRLDSSYSSTQRELSSVEIRDYYSRAGFDEVNTVPQGILSTPFAEVVMRPQIIAKPLALFACAIDRLVEKLPNFLLAYVSWNIVATGRKPV